MAPTLARLVTSAQRVLPLATTLAAQQPVVAVARQPVARQPVARQPVARQPVAQQPAVLLGQARLAQVRPAPLARPLKPVRAMVSVQRLRERRTAARLAFALRALRTRIAP